MARYYTLGTALKLLWTRNVESVATEELRRENLSSQEKRRLKEQLDSSQAWQPGGVDV